MARRRSGIRRETNPYAAPVPDATGGSMHQGQAQYPDSQRLMMTGQHRAGEIVEAARTGFAPVALAMRLCVVAPVANHHTVAASRAANAIWPAVLTHQREALGIIQQR